MHILTKKKNLQKKRTFFFVTFYKRRIFVPFRSPRLYTFLQTCKKVCKFLSQKVLNRCAQLENRGHFLRKWVKTEARTFGRKWVFFMSKKGVFYTFCGTTLFGGGSNFRNLDQFSAGVFCAKSDFHFLHAIFRNLKNALFWLMPIWA